MEDIFKSNNNIRTINTTNIDSISDNDDYKGKKNNTIKRLYI
jgi:hypothetical protein